MKVTAALQTKKYPRFLFDVDFDAAPPPPEPDPEELAAQAAPTFSEEELARARETAREEGRLEGLSQSNSGFEHQISELVAVIDKRFAALHAAQLETNEVIARSAIRVAAAIATKLAPEYAKQNGLEEIEAFVTQCLSALFGEVEVTIHAPPDTVDTLTERLAPIAQRRRLENGIRVVADPALGPSDCRIDWSDGGAERNCEGLLASMDEIVERFLAHSRDEQDAAEDAPATETDPAAPTDPVAAAADTAASALADTGVAAEPAPAPAPDETPEPEAPAAVDTGNDPATETLEPLPATEEIADAAAGPDATPEPAEPPAPEASPEPEAPPQAAAAPAVDTPSSPPLPGGVTPEPPAPPSGGPGLPGAVSPGGAKS